MFGKIRFRLLAGVLASAVLAAPSISSPVYDQEKFGTYLELRDCTAMTAAAAIVTAREFGHVSQIFHHFWVAAQTGEATLVHLLASGVVSPTGELVKMDRIKAEWEPYVERNVEILDEDSDYGDEAWSYAHGCADNLTR